MTGVCRSASLSVCMYRHVCDSVCVFVPVPASELSWQPGQSGCRGLCPQTAGFEVNHQTE